MKTCPQCPNTEFYRDRTRPDGLSRLCKSCDDEKRLKRYRDHREEETARMRARYRKNSHDGRSSIDPEQGQ